MFPVNERDGGKHDAIDDKYACGSLLFREEQRNKRDQRCPEHDGEQHTEGVERDKAPWPSTPHACDASQRKSEHNRRQDVHDRPQGAMLEVAGEQKRPPSYQR